ncbi:MAG: DUF1292 domain-containing protein [Solobacterium sp.]|nr:DUF1292 domain-containing protein [Solobacterium sp.]
MEEKNTIIITDDNGNEKEFTILFTFEVDENDRQYVVIQDQDNKKDVYGFRYTADGELLPLDDEETEMVSEVLEAWEGENL